MISPSAAEYWTQWTDDSIILMNGRFTRWRLHLCGMGYVTVEHHEDCAGKTGSRHTCPTGWQLKGIPLFSNGEHLKAETLEDAKKEAILLVRKALKRAIQELPVA